MDFIENVIVNSSKWEEGDDVLLFGNQLVHFTNATTIEELLVELGIYPSKSAARRVGRCGPIPVGWTDEYKASKVRRLWIWNPAETTDEAAQREIDMAERQKAIYELEKDFV